MAVTVYEEIADPPSVIEADQEMVTCPEPVICATGETGADGKSSGVADGELALAVDDPVAFVATTDAVYETPFVSPVAVHVV
jgi:hypothetical protein